MSTTRGSPGVFQPDVIVIGGGLIGLACATAVAQEGARVRIISARDPGAASPASAGILAPCVGRSPPRARALGILSRDMYPEWLGSLEERTGHAVALARAGVLEIAFDHEEAAALRGTLADDAEWVEGDALRVLEPLLAPAVGAVHHRRDGSVDVHALLNALQVDAKRDRRISVIDGRAGRIVPGERSVGVELVGGEGMDAHRVILAAGAWAASIVGLCRPLPVAPARGQIVSFAAVGLGHVVIGRHGYLVPRADRTLVGSTMEHVGFDASITADAGAMLRQAAAALAPVLDGQSPLEQVAGLRPMTPDLLPVVGPDPDYPGVIYACGHSKNGVLLAPLTARAVANAAIGRASPMDLSAYAISRF